MDYKLDLKDRRLLYELELDSRQSFGDLAKKLRLSKNTIAYRIHNLEKEGIIKKFYAVIDVGKLGYINFRVYLKLQNVTPMKEKEIIDFLVAKKCVNWVVSIDGDYNLGFHVLSREIKEMNEVWMELLEKYVNYVDERLLTIVTKKSHYSRSFLINSKENENETVYLTEPKKPEVDEIDKGILELLAKNARIPIIEIASTLKITSKTVIARIKKLENDRVIVSYKTGFNLSKLGYEQFRLILRLHNTTKERISSLIQHANVHPNIISHSEVLGGDDFEMDVEVNDLSALRKIIDEIKDKFADIIQAHKTMQFYQEHENFHYPV
jgi:Lrp/AsnC family leucine-responsive transcriptional regulator